MRYVDLRQYRLSAPIKSHWRKATCAEIDCPNYVNGWSATIDTSTPLGQRQARYIRYNSGRHYSENATADGIVTFIFPPGQTCFGSDRHRIRIDREPLYVIRETGKLNTVNGSEWTERFNNDSEKLERMRNNG